jgi:hypothetical protein
MRTGNRESTPWGKFTMSGNDLPAWVNYAQFLVIPFVAVVGAGIAGGQLLLARRRMQLDLYDRRYKIFESARRLIVDIMREGRAEVEWIYRFHRDTGDAVFLLDNAAVGYIAELEKRAFRLRRVGVIIANDGHPQREAAIDEEVALLSWFSEQFDVLIERFKPSLQLKSRWL